MKLNYFILILKVLNNRELIKNHYNEISFRDIFRF